MPEKYRLQIPSFNFNTANPFTNYHEYVYVFIQVEESAAMFRELEDRISSMA